ncbi:hypothetical protein TrST_g5098 [Triparma strigata]|uniref:Uncharacterized protein n=1 Tax=Triparma strigata TaxID=1606541 RepID=A0A9W7B061_9STRA|nr:hypothetical protein TrST_g5098 [Triparma strigata]
MRLTSHILRTFLTIVACAVLPAIRAHPQLLLATSSPSRAHTQTHSGQLKDGSDWKLSTTFHVHDDVEIHPETHVATRSDAVNKNGERIEVSHQRAIKKGSMTLDVSPPTQPFEPRRLATTFCDETCAPYRDILPLEAPVKITWNGTEYTVGEYELCLECLEYKYEFNHIRNWTVFNYDLDKDEVIQPAYTIDIPTLEASSGDGTTSFAAHGFSCINCYAYLAPSVQLTLQWNQFYITDFSASLIGRSKVNIGVGFLDPVILEIGQHFYEIYNETNFTDAVDFGLFTMDSKKSMTFAVDGFGQAAGAGSITGEMTASGQISSRYKKLSAADPHLWTYDYGAKWAANITDIDISHLDLEEFGADFSLIPSMDIRVTGTGFPFEGLVATTTAQIRATAGFEISNKIPDANLQVYVENDSGTAGEDLQVKISWKNIPSKREDIINVFIHNDCWASDVKHKVISQKHYFSSTKGSTTLTWNVPYDASLSQLNFLGYDDFAGLKVCESDKFYLSVMLEKDKISEYHSNEFTLLVNAVDGGYGVTKPWNNDVLYFGELNEFEWNSASYVYFNQGDPTTPAELTPVANVSIVLYGAETDCTGSDLVDSLVGLFDPRWGCEESWVQITDPGIANSGSANVYVPPKTLDDQPLIDFHEVHASIIGVDNTNVFSRNKGSFKVFEGCPSSSRYKVSFYIEGDSTLTNGVWHDTATGFYFSVAPPSKRGDTEYTARKGKSEDVDWNAKPSLNHQIDVVACEGDNINLRLYEVDDQTLQRLCCDAIGDDDYGQWPKTMAEWIAGEDGSGDGAWQLEAWFTGTLGSRVNVGKFPVRVETTLLSENGVPVGGRRALNSESNKREEEELAAGKKATKNLRSKSVEVIPARENRRRLHHDDCVTAYYHVESLLEMTKVTYTQPDALEEITDPIANFLGYENVKTMTLYNEPEPVRIDVIPFTEYTLHNFEGFDCSQFRQPASYWEDLWEGFLAGDAGNIAIVVGGGAAATGGFAFVVWLFAFGGAGLTGWVGGKKAGNALGRGSTELVDGGDEFERDTDVVGKSRATSAFENENPMAKAHLHSQDKKKISSNALPPPPPPPPPAIKASASVIKPNPGFAKTFQKVFMRNNSSMATETELTLAMKLSQKKGNKPARPKADSSFLED